MSVSPKFTFGNVLFATLSEETLLFLFLLLLLLKKCF